MFVTPPLSAQNIVKCNTGTSPIHQKHSWNIIHRPEPPILILVTHLSQTVTNVSQSLWHRVSQPKNIIRNFRNIEDYDFGAFYKSIYRFFMVSPICDMFVTNLWHLWHRHVCCNKSDKTPSKYLARSLWRKKPINNSLRRAKVV